VIQYGHSAGSVGAIIAASRKPSKNRLLFLEASYAETKEALLSLYTWVNKGFGKLFGRMIIFWLNFFYRGALDDYSPANLAGEIRIPVMIIHGEKDTRFPIAFAKKMKNNFKHKSIFFYAAKNAGHSDSSCTPGYCDAIKSFIDQYLPETFI
jgi:pimeloyl-ACP methyl ester carboxylesterase